MISSRVPVTVLTGFLGSGKTTLLQRLLRAEGGQNVAVLINELGEIGLDHLLVKAVTETAVVLQNGCICCTIRSDLQRGLRDLIDGRSRGDVPPFDRILLETTGLADPFPIVQTVANDLMLRRQVRLANIVTTVDVLNGADQLDSHDESRRQAVIADRLVLTKTDLVPAERATALHSRLSALNPTAIVYDAQVETSLWDVLLGSDSFDETTRTSETRRWLRCLPAIDAAEDVVRSRHEEDIHTFSIRVERPIDWTVFGVWLSALVHRHGAKILRIKGLLDVPDANGPVVLNTVQRHIHPPFHLDAWPDQDRASRLVFIVKGLDPDNIRRSLDGVLASAGPLKRTELLPDLATAGA
jgi:G3E family GTPase